MSRNVRFYFYPALCFILLLTTADCFALRCGEQIVHIGEDMYTVNEKCGRPDVFSVKKIRTSPDQPNSNYKGYYFNTSGSGSWHDRSDEEWLYNCGDGDFAYTLIFEDNVLVREDTQRGYGPNKCISGYEKQQLERKKEREEQIKARKDKIKRGCPGNNISLMQLRIQHFSKARELFPDENNMTRQFEMYRQQYMTDEERKLMPLFTAINEDRCVPMNLHNVRTYMESKSFRDSPDPGPDKTIADVKQKPVTNEHESSSWFQCKDKDGNVTLSNVGCPE